MAELYNLPTIPVSVVVVQRVSFCKHPKLVLNMNPLIKWAGGKSDELKHIKYTIPQFNRYFEPFLGGGALYFELEPQKGYVNDVSADLILFYKLLKEKNGKKRQFKEELYAYVKNWEKINKYMEHFGNSFLTIYNKFKSNKITDQKFNDAIRGLFEKKIIPFNGLFSNSFCINQNDLRVSIQKNVVRRLKRVKDNIDIKNHFSDKEIMKNVETAFRSGFYLHFRSIMNKFGNGAIELGDEKRIANYYFVREFCYGGMFRFNDNGEFNVPYGGNAYNKKDFRKKVDSLFNLDVGELLDRTIIDCMDFEAFLNKHKPTDKDFIFFDPPYDTEFSEYEVNPFNRQDQERLAKIIRNLDAKFILIIKETPFIKSLYEGHKGINIASFDKLYKFNIRGRNDTGVRHLIIHNFERLPEQKNLKSQIIITS